MNKRKKTVQKPGIFRLLWMTSTEFGIYSEYSQKPSKEIVLYIIKLLIIIGFVLGIALSLIGFLFLRGPLMEIKDGIPELILEEGQMKSLTDKKYSYTQESLKFNLGLNLEKTKEDDFAEKTGYSQVIFNRDGGVFHVPGKNRVDFVYPKLKSKIYINKDTIAKYEVVFWFISFFIYPLMFFGFQMSSFLFYAVVFAGVYYIFSSVDTYKYNFSELFNVALLANGPAFFYAILIRILGFSIPSMFMIVYVIFFLGAVSALNKQVKKLSN